MMRRAAAFLILSVVSLPCAQAASGSTLTTAEQKAEAVWRTRAALNVAALQCQYDPALNTVANYNQFAKQHKAGLDEARSRMESSFRRRYGKAWASRFDQYNTKTYNSLSATNAQVAYCTKMADVGTRALAAAPEGLTDLALLSLPEIEALFPKPVAPPVQIAKAKTGKGKKSKKKKSRRA
jgi:hypothetical protein